MRAKLPAKELGHDQATPPQVDTLVALIGVEATANLGHFGGGHRVPSYDQFRSWERRVRLLNDYLAGAPSEAPRAALVERARRSAIRRSPTLGRIR
jgi:hypothetical protein